MFTNHIFILVLNHRHRMAQQAARSSVELYTNIYFKDKLEQTEGHVVRVLKNGFIVLVPKFVPTVYSLFYMRLNDLFAKMVSN